MAGMTAGKGDTRRPTFIDEETFEERWRRTFGAPSAGRESQPQQETADNRASGAAIRTRPGTAQTEESDCD